MSVKTRPSHTESPGTMERRETGTRNTGGAAREKSQSSRTCVPKASGIQDFQNVDTVALGDQRELSSGDSF